MDKALFKEKVDSMMPDLTEGIRRECDRLYESGAVDTGAFEDNYLLPKVILTVAIENQVRQYNGATSQLKKEIRNLRHF